MAVLPVSTYTKIMTEYRGRHNRVVYARGKAAEHLCVKCGKTAEDWARIHGLSGEDPDDYQPMCTRCHVRYDRGIPDGKCGNGHDLSGENLYVRESDNRWVCRACGRARRARERARRRVEV